jgi:hypothetical protein
VRNPTTSYLARVNGAVGRLCPTAANEYAKHTRTSRKRQAETPDATLRVTTSVGQDPCGPDTSADIPAQNEGYKP